MTIKKHHVTKTAKGVISLYITSIIVLSIAGAYIGLRGKYHPITSYPTSAYADVTFKSKASDNLQLDGWFFPAASKNLAIIVHGWSGNRSRFVYLAQYLQSRGINVLTFDLRGGTGQNTYGFKEEGDIAGAIVWAHQAGYNDSNISLIGNSMGASSSISYVSKNYIKSLVLVSPVTNIDHIKYLALKNRHYFLPAVYAAGSSFVERMFYGIKPTNPKDIFSQITTPTYVLHGLDDELSPVTDTKLLEKQNTKTNIIFEYVSGANHTFLDADPQNNFLYSTKIADYILSTP